MDDENITYAGLKRIKRQIDSYDPYESKPNKTRCPLLLVADYRFFQEMGGSDTKTTINYLVNTSHPAVSSCSYLYDFLMCLCLCRSV